MMQKEDSILPDGNFEFSKLWEVGAQKLLYFIWEKIRKATKKT